MGLALGSPLVFVLSSRRARRPGGCNERARWLQHPLLTGAEVILFH